MTAKKTCMVAIPAIMVMLTRVVLTADGGNVQEKKLLRGLGMKIQSATGKQTCKMVIQMKKENIIRMLKITSMKKDETG